MPLNIIGGLFDALLSFGFIADGATSLFSSKKRAKLLQKGRGYLISALIFSTILWLLVLTFAYFAVSFYFAVSNSHTP